MRPIYQCVEPSALATILQVAFFSCTCMLTVMTNLLHNKAEAKCMLRTSKRARRIGQFIASQDGSTYAEVCGSMRKYAEIAYR